MDKYVNILKEKGIKVTAQRLEILKFLDTHHSHPSADEIYIELKKLSPALSKTTVYNTIQSLKEHRLLHSLNIDSNESRFDSVINPHHHLLCSACGNVIDIEIECPYTRKMLSGGHRIDEVHGYFKGICISCLKKGGI